MRQRCKFKSAICFVFCARRRNHNATSFQRMNWLSSIQRYYRVAVVAFILATITVLFLETSFCRDCFPEKKTQHSSVVVRSDLRRLHAPFIRTGENQRSSGTFTADGARENRFAQILVTSNTDRSQLAEKKPPERPRKPFSVLRLNKIPGSETFLHWAVRDKRQPNQPSFIRIFASNRSR